MRIKTPTENELKIIRKYLKKYGDIPPEEATKATTKKTRTQWLMVIDSDGTFLGAGRTYQKDWYEWVVKNAFVLPEARNKKVATLLYAKLTDKAEASGASIAEADITSDNIPSKVAAVRAGMRPVNSFRWTKKKSEKPADVYQEVFMPPSQKEVKTINADIIENFKKRNKPIIPEVLMPYPVTKRKRY